MFFALSNKVKGDYDLFVVYLNKLNGDYVLPVVYLNKVKGGTTFSLLSTRLRGAMF